MKSILAIILLGASIIYLLRTDLTPYRLVSRSEMQASQAPVATVAKVNPVYTASNPNPLEKPPKRVVHQEYRHGLDQP